jgi:hypothetical protein
VKELQQAEALLREQGEERARAIVTYALQEAPRTGFQMQHFGAVLGYQEAALEALTRHAQQEQHHQEERQRWDAAQQRVQQDWQQQERAAALLAQLPEGVPVATEQKTSLRAREPLRPCVARPVRRDVVSE